MNADQTRDEPAGNTPERFRTGESYIHWDRGLAIVAGMIGIVLLFVLLLVALPIRESSGTEQLTGIEEAPAPTAAATQSPASAAATAVAPDIGPDQPRLPATTNQFPFIRRGPGTDWATLGNLRQGQMVEVVGRSPDRLWLQIVLPTNARERGWVSQEFLMVEGDVDTLPEVRQ